MGFFQYQTYEMTITPTNNEGKGAASRKNFITPQDC